MAYSEKVMDHFANPRNVGEIENADGIGEVGNSKCGDIMKMYIKVDNDIITDVKFKTFGCGAAIATSSMAVWQQSLSRASQSMTLSSSQTRRLWRLLTDFRLSRFTALFLQNRQSRQPFRTTTKEEALIPSQSWAMFPNVTAVAVKAD